jgi:hypothetical protein
MSGEYLRIVLIVLKCLYLVIIGWDSSVGIGTLYGLDGRRGGGARFSSPVQTASGAHPASCTMDGGSLSQGVKRLVRGVNHPPPSSAEVKERVELYLDTSSGPP